MCISENGENTDGSGSCDLADESNTKEHTKIEGNLPYIVETFIASDSLEHVGVLVALPGGASNVRFELNEEGNCATVTYDWPKASYDMSDLFSKKLRQKAIMMDNPLILAFQRGLAKKRDSIDAIPQTAFDVLLPIKVQTAVDSWTKTGVARPDGTKVVYADFVGLENEHNKQIKDTSVTFES